jgi:2',3'-cyclic-nucleotide 3'-phosphodiesterase
MSIWLIPPDSYKPGTALSRLTSTSFPGSANFPRSPGFPPHITLTSNVPKSSSALLPTLNLDSLATPEVEYTELAHGNEYFKFIFLRIRKTATLLELARHIRERVLPESTFDENLYDPHISLVYSSEPSTENRVEFVAWKTSMAIANSRGWKGGKVVLVDTSADVREWKVIEEYSFPDE